MLRLRRNTLLERGRAPPHKPLLATLLSSMCGESQRSRALLPTAMLLVVARALQPDNSTILGFFRRELEAFPDV